MESDAAAQAYFDEALAVDDALRAGDAALRDTSALEARIMAAIGSPAAQAAPAGLPAETPAETPAAAVIAAQTPRRKAFFDFRPRDLFAPGSGLLALAVIGFLVGFQPAAEASDDLGVLFLAHEQVVGDDSALLNGGGL